MNRLITFFFALLLTASFMWPSEGAIHGDGLHLAIGWLLVAVYSAVAGFGRPAGILRLNKADLIDCASIGLLICGFWLSTWHVFRLHGDRRAALNLAFEWSAIGAVWWTVRNLIQDVNARQWIVATLVAIGFGTACVGIAQHHVSHGRQAEWYQQQRSRIDDGGVDAVLATQELQRANIPLSGTSRELFERRLLASSEPIGPFALANTLGGLLAVALVLIVGGQLHVLRERSYKTSLWSWSLLVLFVFVLGYCLLLTKSRTAWVGLCCGVVLVFLQGRTLLTSGRMKRVVLVAVTVLALGAAIGIGSGAIDKEVVSESPRSLQFRLFYWMGAAGVISDEPIFGAGPGNFRSVYLAHKVVESSEEILDPHNILLDAWCSAGIIGFCAVCLLLLTVALRSLGTRPTAIPPSSRKEGRSALNAVRFGVFGGMLLHLIWRWLNGGEFIDASRDVFDTVNLVVVIPIVGLLSMPAIWGRVLFTSDVMRAAFVCLFVHLLGAGGLQISGLGLLLILLHALSSDVNSDAAVVDSRSERSRRWFPAVVFSAVAMLAAWQGLLPVTAAARDSELAAMLKSQHRYEAAVSQYDQAISEDPYDLISRQRKLEVLSYLFVSAVDSYALRKDDAGDTIEGVLSIFERANQACDDVIAGNQQSYAGYYFRSRLRQQRYRVTPVVELAEGALDDMQQVLSRYPTNALFWFEYSQLLQRFDRSDKLPAAVARALEIDDVNHNWGHVDRYLADDQVQWLNSMTSFVDSE